MNLTIINARDLSDAWFQCIQEAMDGGYEYVIDKGSFEGQKRKEFDFVVIKIEYPRARPLAPDIPLGVPPPTTSEYIDNYMSYLMTSTKEKIMQVAPTTAVPINTGFAVALKVLPAPSLASR